MNKMGQMIGQLRVKAFSGLTRQNEKVTEFGDLKPLSDLPKRAVRRFSDLERGVISCLMGLNENLEGGLGNTPIVLASRYGAMTNTLELLRLINQEETLSPTAFSLSVHNAAVGVASQLTKNQGGHTAIAAGERSLHEGLTECYARLVDGQEQVVLIYSDCQLVKEYAHFGQVDVDVQFALLLDNPPETLDQDIHQISLDVQGAIDSLIGINAGAVNLQWKM